MSSARSAPRLGVLGTALTGSRPTGLGVYVQAVLEHTPWPDDALLFAERATADRCWPGRPRVETPPHAGLGPRLLWQLARLDPLARANECGLLYAPTHELLPSVSTPTRW